MKDIDWKSLEFKCIHEKDNFPKVDKEADLWFQEARALQRNNKEGTEQAIVDNYEKAVAKDHFKAILNLSRIYALGDGVPEDHSRAVDLMQRAIAMNIPAAYYGMGNFLEQGIGVKQDKLASMTYYRKAADLGNPQGQYVVGEKLIGLFATSPDKGKGMPIAIKMLECALHQGYAQAGLKLGSYFLIGEENIERGLFYYQQTAALGSSQALYNLYSTFENGDYNIKKDPARAACYKRLEEEADTDITKTFPNIDKICPLPPKPMP